MSRGQSSQALCADWSLSCVFSGVGRLQNAFHPVANVLRSGDNGDSWFMDALHVHSKTEYSRICGNLPLVWPMLAGMILPHQRPHASHDS